VVANTTRMWPSSAPQCASWTRTCRCFIIARSRWRVRPHIAVFWARDSVVFFDRIVPDIETDAVLIDNLPPDPCAVADSLDTSASPHHHSLAAVIRSRNSNASLSTSLGIDDRCPAAPLFCGARAAGLPVDPA